jgi:hypothetical protein
MGKSGRGLEKKVRCRRGDIDQYRIRVYLRYLRAPHFSTATQPQTLKMVRNVKIALLVCDTPVKKVVEDFGEYPNIFRTWIGASKPTDENVTFTMDAYDVRKEWSEEGQKEKKYGEYPRDDALKGEGRYDGIIITGSGLFPLLYKAILAILMREYSRISIRRG